jgi:hypothetical protein
LSSIAIIANGASVKDHDLTRIPPSVKVMTLNRSWQLRMWPDMHLALDHAQSLMAPSVYEDLADRKILWCAGAKWVPLVQRGANEVKFCHDGRVWSSSRDDGFVEGYAGNGSVTYAALQLATWLGHSEIYVLGLDLGGYRFDGSKPSEDILRQNVLMQAGYSQLQKYGIGLWNVGSPNSRCTDIPKITFQEMLDREGEAEKEAVVLDQPAMAEPQ